MKLFPQIGNIDGGDASAGKQSGETRIRFVSSGFSDAGPYRKSNEDRYLDDGRNGVWAVADGMGGHRDGGRAAQSTLDAVAAAAANGETIAQAVKNANALLYADGLVNGTTGATVAILQIAEGVCRALWAGDCRVYRIRRGTLTQLTEDHSEVNKMIRAGLISKKEALTHPLRNVVTRAVGAHETLELENLEYRLRSGDGFLLCSDGLTNTLDEDQILKSWNDPQALVREAVSRKAQDNVTALAVQVIDATEDNSGV